MPVADPKPFQHRRRGKPFYKSKVIWANVVMVGMSLHPLAQQHSAVFVPACGAINVLLRSITTEKLSVKKR